ncbi:uncharacterized protein RCC_08717 [Ramularia collo-cygni]|uniref:MYND-type domain-containing protein n=1 Tax=Ramularia collo-cygni TaxID=112498 RepID=A0A2D3UY67_9PEZI|nr:uncharacterized protein RCC_08717 [Ramularia collo-cygni]CZT23007.1 uncharacterized protein RCC_08717 [Ramularia collo-cygni]
MSSATISCISRVAGPTSSVTAISEVMNLHQKIEVTTADFNDASQWELSLLSVKIGFGLKIKVIATNPPSTTENDRVSLLFLDQATLVPTRRVYGDVIIARCDGKPLHFFHAWFVLEQLDAMRVQGGSALFKANMTGNVHVHHRAREAVASMFAPKFFVATFKTAKERLLMPSPQADASLENPWINIVKACGTCGVAQVAGGGPLLKCSRCNSAWYCSTECQKEAWKGHKAECTKEMKAEKAIAGMQEKVRK